MAFDAKTKELLAKGKAKMETRLAIVKGYLRGIKQKAIATDVIKAGKAKQKAREEIVKKYLAQN